MISEKEKVKTEKGAKAKKVTNCLKAWKARC